MTRNDAIRALKCWGGGGCEESGESRRSEEEEIAVRRLCGPDFGPQRDFRGTFPAEVLCKSAGKELRKPGLRPDWKRGQSGKEFGQPRRAHRQAQYRLASVLHESPCSIEKQKPQTFGAGLQ